MKDIARRSVFSSVEGSEQFADQLIRKLTSPNLSISPCQSTELVKFLTVCRDEMNACRRKTEESGDDDFYVQALLGRQREFENALQFIDQAVVAPRWQDEEQPVLVAADWVCITGFRKLVPESVNAPVGPLVAMDSRQSPAVWKPNDQLPLPSLFQKKPVLLDRTQDVEQSKLGWFPLVCLPSDLSRSSQYYPLFK